MSGSTIISGSNQVYRQTDRIYKRGIVKQWSRPEHSLQMHITRYKIE